MRLIADKPCNFGGRKFYIGDEIPEDYVADAKQQEKMGVITIINDGIGALGGQSGVLFTREQVEAMIAEAVEDAGKKKMDQMAGVREYAAELDETEPGAYDGVVAITIKGAIDGQLTTIPARPGEIQQVFSVMQMNAEEGARVIADIWNEDALALLHAADSRKTIKDAAKRQAEKLFPAGQEPDDDIGAADADAGGDAI